MDVITKQWVERAEYDLETADHLLASGRYLYVAFMCQQTLEKIIKANIAAAGKTPSYVHHLLRLAEEGGFLDTMEDNHRLLLADLNPYYIKARYGEYKDKLASVCTQEKAKRFFRETKELVKWLKARIKSKR